MGVNAEFSEKKLLCSKDPGHPSVSILPFVATQSDMIAGSGIMNSFLRAMDMMRTD